jgi:hypothetical protein
MLLLLLQSNAACQLPPPVTVPPVRPGAAGGAWLTRQPCRGLGAPGGICVAHSPRLRLLGSNARCQRPVGSGEQSGSGETKLPRGLAGGLDGRKRSISS